MVISANLIPGLHWWSGNSRKQYSQHSRIDVGSGFLLSRTATSYWASAGSTGVVSISESQPFGLVSVLRFALISGESDATKVSRSDDKTSKHQRLESLVKYFETHRKLRRSQRMTIAMLTRTFMRNTFLGTTAIGHGRAMAAQTRHPRAAPSPESVPLGLGRSPAAVLTHEL